MDTYSEPSSCQYSDSSRKYIVFLAFVISLVWDQNGNEYDIDDVRYDVDNVRKERSGRRGFSISSPELWNLLPADIRLLYN